ncbi:hypothetical protein H4582DRAFT_2060403 [Lactarius indigo]|nr:hypothetical protein H4582DRAFT_2060403 [Lactarius indigo]
MVILPPTRATFPLHRLALWHHLLALSSSFDSNCCPAVCATACQTGSADLHNQCLSPTPPHSGFWTCHPIGMWTWTLMIKFLDGESTHEDTMVGDGEAVWPVAAIAARSICHQLKVGLKGMDT